MQYQSSKGAVEISTMPLSYAKNALNKLVRSGETGRTAEIDALQAHVDKLVAEAEVAALAGPAPREAVIGDNGPPADEAPSEVAPKWETVQIHMDDLLSEAANWADGVEIVAQSQADAVAALREKLQEAADIADEARKVEKAPFDLQIGEIQDRYNAYIAPIKNRHPGSVTKARLALSNLLTPWLKKVDDEKREREKAAREAEVKALAAAQAAHKEAAGSSDLGAIEDAAVLMEQAEAATAAKRAVEREKVQARGEHRAVPLRSYWRAEMIEGQGAAALKHYLQRHPDRVKAFLQHLADEDVKAGARSIPGFNIIEDRKVA